MSLADRLGLLGSILAFVAMAATYLWPDKKWIGWLALFCATVLVLLWGWLEIGAELPTFRSHYPILSTTIVFIIGGCLAGALWRLAVPVGIAPQGENQPTETKDKKPPTLLDLFRRDFPTTLKATDTDVDAYTIGSLDGFTVKVKRQLYEDFDAKVKFVGFYISNPTPPATDFSGKHTLASCIQLLNHGAVEQTLEHFDKQVLVMAGYADQMTKQGDLTFSGRVLIYHEEYLSIPQKADVLKAYKEKHLDVIFRGTDYLGTQTIAWHQQHDKKAQQAKSPE